MNTTSGELRHVGFFLIVLEKLVIFQIKLTAKTEYKKMYESEVKYRISMKHCESKL
jgi:hypothetical protein